MLGFPKNFITEQIKKEKWASKAQVDEVFWENLEEWIFKGLLPDFVTELSSLIDSIINIDPEHSEKEILELVAKIMVETLDASFASVRIYDPDTEQMLSYCSFPSEEESPPFLRYKPPCALYDPWPSTFGAGDLADAAEKAERLRPSE